MEYPNRTTRPLTDIGTIARRPTRATVPSRAVRRDVLLQAIPYDDSVDDTKIRMPGEWKERP